jgi:hypothetical protein
VSDRFSKLRIVVCGYVVRGPLGGISWHHLQYMMGLADLGHEVWFFEDSGEWPGCYDPERGTTDERAGYGLAYAQRIFDRTGFGQRWAYYDRLDGGGVWKGAAAAQMAEVCRTSDVVLNVSGVNPLAPWFERVPLRVLIDTDPVFTQVDILVDADRRRFAESHNAFFTFAESYHLAQCSVPRDGLPWLPTRQPVVLRAWPYTPGAASEPERRWTTVMLWDSYDVREWQGVAYGMKSQEMERVLNMPARCGQRFELALGGPTAPHNRLEAHGWHWRNPLEVTIDPWVYQNYLGQSRAEFSVAKHGYAASRSGWFSERSANYLALGRPVVVQDTGFSLHLPTGEGLLAFDTVEQAQAAVVAVEADHARHSQAARALVESHFDARAVLQQLLQQAEGALTRRPTP